MLLKLVYVKGGDVGVHDVENASEVVEGFLLLKLLRLQLWWCY